MTYYFLISHSLVYLKNMFSMCRQCVGISTIYEEICDNFKDKEFERCYLIQTKNSHFSNKENLRIRIII
jgi:hypothetical protein